NSETPIRNAGLDGQEAASPATEQPVGEPAQQHVSVSDGFDADQTRGRERPPVRYEAISLPSQSMISGDSKEGLRIQLTKYLQSIELLGLDDPDIRGLGITQEQSKDTIVVNVPRAEMGKSPKGPRLRKLLTIAPASGNRTLEFTWEKPSLSD